MAGGVKLVEVETQERPVAYRNPSIERQSHSENNSQTNGVRCFLAAVRLAGCDVLYQILPCSQPISLEVRAAKFWTVCTQCSSRVFQATPAWRNSAMSGTQARRPRAGVGKMTGSPLLARGVIKGRLRSCRRRLSFRAQRLVRLFRVRRRAYYFCSDFFRSGWG
jgi:hypothetical protein